MADEKLVTTDSQTSLSSCASNDEKRTFSESESRIHQSLNKIRFLETEDAKVSELLSEYYAEKEPSTRCCGETDDECNTDKSVTKYVAYRKTPRRGLSKTYKRVVICPKCDLQVSSFSTDFVRCRRCGLRYTFPYSDRPFERDENTKSTLKATDDKSSLSESKLLQRKQVLRLECLECQKTRIVYAYPGQIGRCVCKGVMVMMEYRNRETRIS